MTLLERTSGRYYGHHVFQAEEDSKDETNGKKVCLSSADAEAVVSAAETLNNFLNGDNSSTERLSPAINGNDEHSDVSVPVLREIYSARFYLDAILQNHLGDTRTPVVHRYPRMFQFQLSRSKRRIRDVFQNVAGSSSGCGRNCRRMQEQREAEKEEGRLRK